MMNKALRDSIMYTQERPTSALSLEVAEDADDEAEGTMETYETYEYDVLVIGAGGAGLRAVIAAREAGASGGRRTPLWRKAASLRPSAT